MTEPERGRGRGGACSESSRERPLSCSVLRRLQYGLFLSELRLARRGIALLLLLSTAMTEDAGGTKMNERARKQHQGDLVVIRGLRSMPISNVSLVNALVTPIVKAGTHRSRRLVGSEVTFVLLVASIEREEGGKRGDQVQVEPLLPCARPLVALARSNFDDSTRLSLANPPAAAGPWLRHKPPTRERVE